MAKKSSKVLGIICAAVCLLFTFVYFNVGLDGGGGLNVCAGLDLVEFFKAFFAGHFSSPELSYALLFYVFYYLNVILLFVAVLRAGKSGSLLRILPVTVPLLLGITWIVFYMFAHGLFRNYEVGYFLPDSLWAPVSQLSIWSVYLFVIALVAFILAIVLGKKARPLPLIVASLLSAVALIMLVVGISPFGLRYGGASDYYVASIGSLVRYVALWFGTAFACLAAAPYGAAANVSINSSGPVANGAGGGVATAGRANWRPAPTPQAQGGPRAFCPRCGASMGVADKFCRSCGMPVNETRTETPKSSGSSLQGRVPRL